MNFIALFCILPLVFIVQTCKSEKTPLILIPGYAASILHATKENQTIRAYETYPNSDDIFQNHLLCIYKDGYCESTSASDGWKIHSPMEQHGLYAIRNLNPNSTPPRPYFNDLIDFLVNDLQYEPGVSLFGFPYDWRQSTTYSAIQLLQYLNKIKIQTRSSHIDVIAHSMGGLVTKTAMGMVNSKQHNIRKFLSIGTPYTTGGAGWGINFLKPSNLNNPNLNPYWIRQLVINSPNSYEAVYAALKNEEGSDLSPNKSKPPRTLIGYTLNNKPITVGTASEMLEIVKDAMKDCKVSFGGNIHSCEFRQDLLNTIAKTSYEYRRTAISVDHQPAQYFSVMGVLVNTPTIFNLLDPLKDSSPSSELVMQKSATLPSGFVSGDGMVTKGSASGDGSTCRNCRVSFPKSHNGLLHHKNTFKSIRHFMGHSCKWDGVWDVTIMNSKSFKEYIRVGQSAWTAYSKTYDMKGKVWDDEWKGTLVGEYGVAEFTWLMSRDCLTFNGSWRYDWIQEYQWSGVRVMGSECKMNDTIHCGITGGDGERQCVFGYWSGTCDVVSCVDGYCLFNHTCTPCSLEGGYRKWSPVFVLVGMSIVTVVLFTILSRRNTRQ
ncbi:hypothetical protein AKO1_015100 [Acrasis kona]|uniref:Uncharacterized protein n=1 Tax=Acrasis kona TaxID=1008807 RepID=A0AAW2YZZ7_9EUKA